MSKLFFDTEFTGLHKNTDLISIGIVDENGRTFYAECTDYDKSQITPWVADNVIKNLYCNGERIIRVSENKVTACGTKDEIRDVLIDWLAEYDEVQFISDVCHYDFMLLIDLLSDDGTAFGIPNNVSPVCIDINEHIAKYCGCTSREAFDINREDLAQKTSGTLKHNALWDAMVIKYIYDIIN